MSEEKVKNSADAVADSTESEMKPTSAGESLETSGDSKEASAAPVESDKEAVESSEDLAEKKDDRVEETVQSSCVESSEDKKTECSADKKTDAEKSPRKEKDVVESSTNEKKSPEKSSEKNVEEKKSPLKTASEEQSSEKTSDEKKSPQKTVDEKKSPQKTVDEKKSPEETVDEKKSSPKTVKPSVDEKQSPQKSTESSTTQKMTSEKSPQKSTAESSADKKKSSEQTVMEPDSTEGDATANTSKEADGDDDQAKEHLKLLGEGKKAFANNDFLSAADSFGRAAELSRTVYGEFSEKNGETLFLYGVTMLECWKSENTVLGENMKGKDDDEGYDDEEDDDDEEVGEDDGKDAEEAKGDEKMETEESETKVNGDAGAHPENGEAQIQNGEVKENGNGKALNGSAEESEEKEQNGEDPSSSNAEDKTEEKEDEDNYLKVAWEMLDLAKIIYHKVDDKKRLADTYMKLGEVAVESGHMTATEEMKKCLDLRQLFLEPHDRVIAETHFNIGVAFSVFKQFDEATKHFENAKEILQDKMKVLKELNTAEATKEFTEIETIIPELNEKIQDMADSKRDELEKAKTATDDTNGCSSSTAATSAASSNDAKPKPVSNISHLVKRKRKMEDIVADKSAKVCRVEGDDSKTSSDNPDAKN